MWRTSPSSLILKTDQSVPDLLYHAGTARVRRYALQTSLVSATLRQCVYCQYLELASCIARSTSLQPQNDVAKHTEALQWKGTPPGQEQATFRRQSDQIDSALLVRAGASESARAAFSSRQATLRGAMGSFSRAVYVAQTWSFLRVAALQS